MSVYDIQGKKIDDGLSEDAKTALLNAFAHNAWADQNGQTYNDALREALYADNIDHITAVFTPGTHAVYPTDNIESLRNFLVVTVYYNDNTSEEVFKYTLSGDITSTGTKTITVTYDITNTTTFDVTVVANTNGLLYEWDFTKGTTDLRQNKETRLLGHSSSLPYADGSGLHFDAYGKAIVLFEPSEMGISNLVGKTIQVDVASFVPGNESYHTRLIMMKQESAWNSGVVFRGSTNVGWSVYNGSTGGWGTVFSGMTARNAISGHTIGLYINSSKKAKLYLDSTSKGVQSTAFDSDLTGLMIGNHENITAGASFFVALVTGVRIYDMEVA